MPRRGTVKGMDVVLKVLVTIMTVLILSLPKCARAQEWRPCATVTSTVAPASYEPRTPLERIYYATAACWRERALDERSRVRTATVTLEVAREVPPPAELAPLSGVPTWLIFVALGVAGVAAAGAGLLGFELGTHR